MSDEESLSDGDYWSSSFIKLLISIRLEFDTSFKNGKKSRTTLWRQIHREIVKNNVEFPFSMEESKKKFGNMMTTYKRIKKRNSQTGKGRSNWPYFEDFDKVYGSKHFVVAPAEVLIDSLENNHENNDCDTSVELEQPVHTNKKNRKNEVQEIFNLLKEMENEEEKRHLEQMELERSKLKLEEQKIAIMAQLVSAEKK